MKYFYTPNTCAFIYFDGWNFLILRCHSILNCLTMQNRISYDNFLCSNFLGDIEIRIKHNA